MGKATQTTSEGWTLPIWRNRAWASLHKSNFKFSLPGSISKRAKVPWQGPPMRTPSSSAPLLCGLLKAHLIIQTLLHTKHRVCTVASFGSNAAGRGNVPFLPDDVSNSSARVRSEVWSLPAARFCSRPRHVAGVGIGSGRPRMCGLADVHGSKAVAGRLSPSSADVCELAYGSHAILRSLARPGAPRCRRQRSTRRQRQIA